MNPESIKLSERLIHVANYLTPGTKFVDVGSDHAYLPCYVCLKDSQSSAIAGEVNVGPFESAKKTVLKYGLEDRIEVRLADGLQAIEDADKVEEIVIAGMGGALIATILENGKDKLTNVNRIIVQPNINARRVRNWLDEHGYHLTNESILEENGHFYEVLVADRNGTSPYSGANKSKQLFLGPYLLENKSEIFHEKWYHEKVKLKEIIAQMKLAEKQDLAKMSQFKYELQWIEEELSNG